MMENLRVLSSAAVSTIPARELPRRELQPDEHLLLTSTSENKVQEQSSTVPPLSPRVTKAFNRKHATTQIASPCRQHILPEALCQGVKDLPDMSPFQTTDVNVSTALRDYAALQYTYAITQVNRVLVDPFRFAFLPRFIRGLSNNKLNQTELAMKDFAVCCRVAKEQGRSEHDQAVSFFNRGVLSLQVDNLRRSMSDFDMAISLFPFDTEYFANRALLHRQRGDFFAAQSDYQAIQNLHRAIEDAKKDARSPSDEARRTSLLGIEPSKRRSKHFSQGLSFSSSLPRRRTACGELLKLADKDPNNNKGTNQFSALNLKANVFGKLHAALTCDPEVRTDEQIDDLIKESRLMAAFVNLHENQLRTLWRYLEYHKFASNVRLFEQGDAAEDYYLVWTGCVSARVKKDHLNENIARALALEKEFTVAKMLAGETLGEAVMEEGGVRRAACVTEEPTEMLVLHKRHFDSTFKQFLQKAHETNVEALSRFECFRSWDKEKLNGIANYCRKRKYHAGDVLAKQGSPSDAVYFIKSGLVSIIKTVHDEQNRSCDVRVSTIYAGDLFGETAVLDPTGVKAFPSSAICEILTIVYRLDRVQIRDDEWDAASKAALLASAVSYPDDRFLLQAHADNVEFQREGAIVKSMLLGSPSSKKKGETKRQFRA